MSDRIEPSRRGGFLRRWLVVAVVGGVVLVAAGAGVARVVDDDPEVEESIVPSTAPTPTTSPPEAAPSTARDWYVSPDGSDDGDGTIDDPLGSVEAAFEALRPGDRLVLRGGTYRENVDPSIEPGRPDAPVRVEAYPGERPVIEGLLWLTDASHWKIRGVNVTWSDENDSDDHMVKFTDGESWEFTDAEVWGARSYAAVLVAGEPSDFLLARLFVHDTHDSNSRNQDHLIYLNSGEGGGVVENCLLVRSENGRAVKIGGSGRSSPDVKNVVIRYNTMVDNLGPSNVQLSYGASDNVIERNIFVRSEEGRAAVTGFRLTGSDNVVRDNLAWDTNGVVEPGIDGLVDAGGNRMADPRFDETAGDGFKPRGLAAEYGHLASR